MHTNELSFLLFFLNKRIVHSHSLQTYAQEFWKIPINRIILQIYSPSFFFFYEEAENADLLITELMQKRKKRKGFKEGFFGVMNGEK